MILLTWILTAHEVSNTSTWWPAPFEFTVQRRSHQSWFHYECHKARWMVQHLSECSQTVTFCVKAEQLEILMHNSSFQLGIYPIRSFWLLDYWKSIILHWRWPISGLCSSRWTTCIVRAKTSRRQGHFLLLPVMTRAYMETKSRAWQLRQWQPKLWHCVSSDQ